MTKICIIKATPGLTTTERILELLREYPEGMTVKQISQKLNRPVSMVNICLRSLIMSKQVNQVSQAVYRVDVE